MTKFIVEFIAYVSQKVSPGLTLMLLRTASKCKVSDHMLSRPSKSVCHFTGFLGDLYTSSCLKKDGFNYNSENLLWSRAGSMIKHLSCRHEVAGLFLGTTLHMKHDPGTTAVCEPQCHNVYGLQHTANN